MKKILELINLYTWVSIGFVVGYFDGYTGKKWGISLLQLKLAREWRAADPSISEAEIQSVFKEIFHQERS